MTESDREAVATIFVFICLFVLACIGLLILGVVIGLAYRLFTWSAGFP